MLLRFTLGVAGAIAAGLAVFRTTVFTPGAPPFKCVTVGLLAAGILALVRLGRFRRAGELTVAYAVLHLGLTAPMDWQVALPTAVSDLLVGWGLILIAVIYGLLAEGGLRFGKFIVVGPLLGGLFLAVSPIAEFHTLTAGSTLRTLLLATLLGSVIGHGVSFGVELAELLTGEAKKTGYHGRSHG